MAAWWEKEASGPKYATLRVFPLLDPPGCDIAVAGERIARSFVLSLHLSFSLT
jgi:hypothetical protein